MSKHTFNRINLEIVRGDSLHLEFTATDENGNDIDLTTGYSAWFQVRQSLNDPAVLTLSSANGDITLNNGSFVVKATQNQTDNKSGQYRWQLEFENPAGEHFTHAGGIFQIQPDYTQPPASP